MESDATVSGDEVARDVAACAESHRRLVDDLRGREPVDPGAPSLLPDWTVGHVLTHIARNADGHVAMLDGRPQYAHGADGRNADIAAGAARSWLELVDDVEHSAMTLEARWASYDDWDAVVTMLSGQRPAHMLPFLRRREVELHRIDLGLGYGFDDLPGDYVRRELRLLEMLWRARKPMGMTPLPPEALAAPPPQRLAWMTGRTTIDGLAPADLF